MKTYRSNPSFGHPLPIRWGEGRGEGHTSLFAVPASRARQGVALVVTLIMLSIITFLTVAFLALSRRDKASVVTSTDQLGARNMAEAALQRAIADMNAGMLANSSSESYGARVMTNFSNSNPAGFRPGQGVGNLNNVNFDVVFGRPVGYLGMLPAHRTELLQNLLYDPRVPVLVKLTNGAVDFRFYLDLNRNGRFDPTLPGQIGDPQWAGVLERSGAPHSGNNQFIGRYTYLVQPIGHSLDWNAIHNQARTRFVPRVGVGDQGSGYWRNQGVGTWEINYAAFLADLNTNIWGGAAGYTYDPFSGPTVRGFSFEDAVQLLAYRYGGNYNLLPFDALFPSTAQTQFRTDLIDGYCSGIPPWSTVSPPVADPDVAFNISKTRLPWVGADNADGLFNLQDVFNPAIVGANFANRLLNAGRDTNSAYNAGTFYRMIEQIGVGSAPERGKINLNYDGTVRGVTNAPFVYVASTNFLPWQPHDFFANAAGRLLAELDFRDTNNIPISINYIPIYPNNYYTPAVHQALQQAVNIFDATTNRWGDTYPNMPTVFRPRFGKTNNTIFIAGYLEVTNSLFLTGPNNLTLDLRVPADRNSARLDLNTVDPPNVLGVPLVIGAKKGLPNFNEVSLQNVITITRRVDLTKNVVGGPVVRTNQQYQLGVTHSAGVELWNSYSNAFPRAVTLVVARPQISLVITNEKGVVVTSKVLDGPNRVFKSLNANEWPAYVETSSAASRASFDIPWETNYVFIPNAAVAGQPAKLDDKGLLTDQNTFPVPKLYLNTSASLQCLIADSATGHVIDYVSLAGLGQDQTVDIIASAIGNVNAEGVASMAGSMWNSNRVKGTTADADMPIGVLNQILVSRGNTKTSPADWGSYSENPTAGRDKDKAIDEFRVFLGDSPLTYPANQVPDDKSKMQVPFTPTRKLAQTLSWQANDPLVHYLATDLTDLQKVDDIQVLTPPKTTQPTNNLAVLNPRYRPWGGNPFQSSDTNAFNLALKDPLVRRSDNWDFPTNKFPNVGWLGRVHRGTPWQTVYLKSSSIDTNAWQLWTGNNVIVRDGNNNRRDSDFTRPANDRKLFDIFTAAVNDNATLGQVSVNQTNLATWSALLSGVVVLSNSTPDNVVLSAGPQFAPRVIAPAAVDPSALPAIVSGIMRTRDSQRNREFDRLGDILAVPELTVESPFVNRFAEIQKQYGIPDTVYERIPEQIMGLLRAGAPRFVVYAYGQSLKPAANSFVAGSQLCTNYQVTAEVAVRAVVRVEGSPDPRNSNNNDPAKRYPPRVMIESFNLLPPD